MHSKPEIAYHASHEQFAPSQLLKLVGMAAQAGFNAIHSSDHFHPWSVRQGQSGFTFSWLPAAMQACELPFSMVCAPGQRLHPAIVAQAIATVCEMFPQRFSIELGSGEAINESITGDEWPDKALRNERLLECFRAIQQLLKGEEVNFEGHIRVKNAKLYTLPAQVPPIFCAAISQQTAEWAGTWADGLITTAGDAEELRKKITGFHQSAGATKPVFVQFAFSYDRSSERAIEGAWEQWRTNILPVEKLSGFSKVQQFDEAAQQLSPSDVVKAIPIFSDMNALLSHVRELMNLDIDRIILHNVNRGQETFIQDFSKAYSPSFISSSF